MDYKIESMTVDDFEEVTFLWRKTKGVGLSESDSQSNIAIFLERNASLSFVARNANHDIVAAVLCGHDGRRGYLHHLAVAENCRRKGIGTCLVTRCLSELGKLGLPKCNIFIFSDNADGRAFWEYGGWVKRDDLGIMQKLIKRV